MPVTKPIPQAKPQQKRQFEKLTDLAKEMKGGGDRHDPTRRCVATGKLLPRERLLRFALAPDGQLVPDIAGKLPGRGLWVTPESRVIAEACRKGAFSRSAKRQVLVGEDLLERTIMLARGHILSLLGLARRGGTLTAGFEKVQQWLREGRAAVLVQAADASPDGRRKLRRLAEVQNVPVVEFFEGRSLDEALGRENTVHIAIASGGIADRFMAEIARLGELMPKTATGGSEQAPSGASG
jgi:predicted RNA-binding protein YlxR (DUF448 family)